LKPGVEEGVLLLPPVKIIELNSYKRARSRSAEGADHIRMLLDHVSEAVPVEGVRSRFDVPDRGVDRPLLGLDGRLLSCSSSADA